ncbi:MAG: DNA repair protein RecO, partial [Flammeovirgaceae bacterium]|nr:DNA repair protein RecO [Flammeovirgaceae bacterium]
MIHKTRGIVFRFTKFGESSIIVTIFTELFGLQSYLVNGVRSKSSKSKIALFQPLTLLDMEVYHRENANINRIKELKCSHPYVSLMSDSRKSAIAMFLNEVVNKSVREESHATDVYEFLETSFRTLDHQETNFENFHLIFLIKLSRYLGFGSSNPDEIMGRRVMGNEEMNLLTILLTCDFATHVPMTLAQRREILESLIYFYKDHIDSLGEIKSMQILKEVMS